MKKIKTYSAISSVNLVVIFLIFFQINLFGQDQPKPDFWGVFLVSNGKLIEFKDQDAKNLSMSGSLIQATMGISSVQGSPYFSDLNTYFIVYGDKMNPKNGQNPVLSKLVWNGSLNMYVAGESVNLKIGPVPGLPDAYKLIPERSLNQGLYCFHSGRLNSTSPMDGAIESNAKKDVWTFWISKEFMGRGQLSSVDISNGEYTTTPSYGLFLIQDSKYIQVPVCRDKSIETFIDNDIEMKGVTELSGIEVDSAKMTHWMVANSENDIRNLIVNVSMRVNYLPYKDMIPERMYLSKLKNVSVDVRTKKQIKKGEPEKITNIWVLSEPIPHLASISETAPTICRIVPIERLDVNAPKIKLSPGVYAFHNGVLNDGKRTFGVTDVVYTFTVK